VASAETHTSLQKKSSVKKAEETGANINHFQKLFISNLLFGKHVMLGWFSVTLKMLSMSLMDESSLGRVPSSSISGRMSLTSGRSLAVQDCSDDRSVEVRFIALDHSHFRSIVANRKWGWMTSSSMFGCIGLWFSLCSSSSLTPIVDDLGLEYRKSRCVLLAWMTSDVGRSYVRSQRHLLDLNNTNSILLRKVSLQMSSSFLVIPSISHFSWHKIKISY